MIKKSERTKDMYVKAAAELEVLTDVLHQMRYTKCLLPAKYLDRLLYCFDIISTSKCVLESQFAKDFAGKVAFEENYLYSIYFNSDCQRLAEEYKVRRDEMRSLIFDNKDGE